MRASKYNVLQRIEKNQYLLGNLLSGALVIIAQDEIETVNRILKDPNDQNINQNLFTILQEEGFLINDNLREIDIVKYNYWKAIMDKEQFILSIVVSYNCNFNCIYCFQQKNQKSSFISENILDRIPMLIKHKIHQGFKKISIGWDGGETTLYFDQIYRVGKNINTICKDYQVEFIHEFSTNGYELDSFKVRKLVEIGVTTLTVTLAGDKKEHDALRRTRQNQDTFLKIFENIKYAKKKIPYILLIINVTRTNVHSMYKLIDKLAANEMFDNVYVNFKQVISFGMKDVEPLCLSKKEYNSYIAKLQEYCSTKKILVGNTHISRPTFCHCFAGRKNSYAIDFNGKIYKCLEQCNNSIGFLDEHGRLVLDEKNAVVDIFADTKCRKCIQLPCCAGGCITKRKQHIDYCPSEKGDIESYLLAAYYRISGEIQKENL